MWNNGKPCLGKWWGSFTLFFQRYNNGNTTWWFLSVAFDCTNLCEQIFQWREKRFGHRVRWRSAEKTGKSLAPKRSRHGTLGFIGPDDGSTTTHAALRAVWYGRVISTIDQETIQKDVCLSMAVAGRTPEQTGQMREDNYPPFSAYPARQSLSSPRPSVPHHTIEHNKSSNKSSNMMSWSVKHTQLHGKYK